MHKHIEMNTRNPFIVSGIIPDEYFCDRQEETQRLVQQIVGRSTNILLMANRRIGKTGLINHCYCQSQLKENFYTFYFDILHTSSLQEFVYEFGKEVYSRLMPQGQKVLMSLAQSIRSLNPKFSLDPLSGLPSFSLEIGNVTQPEYTLDEIFSWLEQADKPCIVSIDEFQRIGSYPEKNIEALLRGKIQNMQNCHFIFSGSQAHLLGDMFQSNKRAFYNSATIMRLDVIDIAKYKEFTQYWFKKGGRQIADNAFEALYSYFDGNTFCLQNILHEAYDAIEPGEECTIETLKQCTNNILEVASYGYREALSRLTTKQKAVLTAIAVEKRVEKITSSAFIHTHHLESASMIQTALRILKDQEWVTVQDKTYSVSDPFFALWLRQSVGMSRR